MAKTAKSSRKKQKLNLKDSGDFLTKEIPKVRYRILELIGYFQEYEVNTIQPEAVNEAKAAAREIMEEIVRILLRAASIEIYEVYEPKGRLISALKSVSKKPHLLSQTYSQISDVVLIEIGKQYQREEENRGTHFYDVTEIGSRLYPGQKVPIATNIKKAAQLAILRIESEKPEGALTRLANIYLAEKLTYIFRRFGREATRFVDPVTTDTNPNERERGDFDEFMQLAIKPLNHLMIDHIGAEGKTFSHRTITRLAIRMKRDASLREKLLCKITAYRFPN